MAIIRQFAAIALSICFAAQQVCYAQSAQPVALPGYLQPLVPAEHFRPMHVRYIGVDEHSKGWEVLLDRGDTAASDAQAEGTARKLMEYFQIGLRLPNNVFWVNLRPDRADEMIDPLLERTDIGKVLLEADLQLKEDLSRMTDPATAQGKQYWQKLYAKAEELYGQQGSAEIPTYTRPWIVPGEIILGESPRGVYIYKAALKVMLESDYIENAQSAQGRLASDTPAFGDARARQLNDYSSQLLKEEIIPRLNRLINSSKRYADLRQVYYSLILAQRYKQRPHKLDHPADTKDLSGLESKTRWDKHAYFKAYQRSFQQGEYSKEEAVASGPSIVIRNYRSGGLKMVIAAAEGASGQVKIVPGSSRFLDLLKGKTDYLIPEASSRDSGAGQRDGGQAEKLREYRDDLNHPKKDSQAVYNLKNFMREVLRENEVARDPEAADVLMEITRLRYGDDPFKDRTRVGEEFMSYLVQSVGKLGNTDRAFDFLRSAFLETKDDKELDAPVWALGFTGSAKAARLLVDTFSDMKAPAFFSKRKSMLEAFRSLARAGVFNNDPLLQGAVRDIAQGVIERETKKWVCEEAVRLLGDLGDQRARSFLLACIAEYGDIALGSLDKLGVTATELAAAFTSEYAKIKHDYYRSLFIGQVFRYSREFNARQLKDLARALDVPEVQLEHYRYFEDAARLVESVVKGQDVFSGDKSWYVLKAEEQLATGVAEETVRSAIAGSIAQDEQYRAFFPTQGLEIELWRNNGTVALNKNAAKVFLERWGITTPHDDVLADSPEGIIEYALGPMSRWERQRDMIEAMRRLELLPAGTFPVHINIGIQRFDEEYNKIFYLGDEDTLKETLLHDLVYPLALAYMPDSRIEKTYQIGNDFKQALQIHKRISPNSYLMSSEGEKESDRFEMRPFTLDTTKETDTQLYEALEASQYVGVLMNAKAAQYYSSVLADKDPGRIWFSEDEFKRVEQIWDTMARRLDRIYQEHSIADIVVETEPKDSARSRLKRIRQEENGKLRQDIMAVIRDAVAETRDLLGQKPAGRVSNLRDGGSVGGIDLRGLPQAASAGVRPQFAQLVKDIPVQTVAMDQEWLAIQDAVSRGKLPPVEQLKRYVAACCRNGSIDRQKENLFVCLAGMLRVEEDLNLATDPFVKDLLSACEN